MKYRLNFMKKHIDIIIAAIIFFVLIIMIIKANVKNNFEEHKEGDYTYVILDNGTVEITKYKGKESEIVIPSELGGLTVTKLGTNSFKSMQDNESSTVEIPPTVTTIGESAFAGCKGLTITGCEGVEEILANAFSECEFTTADSFPVCSNLVKIEYGAFSRVKNIGNFELPEGLEYIGAYAFGGNCHLEEIPQSVKYIGKDGISSAYEYPDDDVAIVGDGILVHIPLAECVIVPYGTKMVSIYLENSLWFDKTDVYIPDTVTRIEYGMFEYEKYVPVTVYIPSSVTYIGCGSDNPDGDNMIVYSLEFATLVVEEGSYAEEYAKKNGLTYELSESVSDQYAQAIIEHNRKFVQEGEYSTQSDILYESDGVKYTLVSDTDQNGIGYEKIIGINTETGEKNEIAKVTLDYTSGDLLKRIVGYRDGVVFYIDSNFRIFSSPVDSDERTELATIYDSYLAEFEYSEDELIISYYTEIKGECKKVISLNKTIMP